MRTQRSILLLFLTLCLLSSQLVSCRGQGAVNSQPNDVAAAPILLRDPSPGQLEAYFNVTMGGYERATRETTHIDLSFTSQGRLVQFVGNEHLTCNGKVVPLHNQVASFQIAEAPTSSVEGKAFSCMYSAGAASASLTVTVAHAPTIRSPLDRARVPRQTNTLITYDVQGGKLQSIVASGPGTKAVARLDTPGSIQATVDTSTLQLGDGSISLTQTLDSQATETGVPFKSFGKVGTAMVTVEVTWV